MPNPGAADFGAQLHQTYGVIKSKERRSADSLLDNMVTLLEYIGFAAIVVVSLGGFVAAIACTFAIWFGHRS
jgi:hypothetical protein